MLGMNIEERLQPRCKDGVRLEKEPRYGAVKARGAPRNPLDPAPFAGLLGPEI